MVCGIPEVRGLTAPALASSASHCWRRRVLRPIAAAAVPPHEAQDERVDLLGRLVLQVVGGLLRCLRRGGLSMRGVEDTGAGGGGRGRTGACNRQHAPAEGASPTCAPHLRAVPDAGEADKLLHTGLLRQLAAPGQWLPGVTLPPHNAHWHRHGLQQLGTARWGGRGIDAQAPAAKGGRCRR